MSSAWALIEEEGNILLIRRALDRGRGGQWCLPGGTMWKGERPEVTCVREAYEETGLRVTIRRPVAVFGDAHYFLCSLNESSPQLKLRMAECIDASWSDPRGILELGTVMDLRRMIPLLELCDLQPPHITYHLALAVPERVF